MPNINIGFFQGFFRIIFFDTELVFNNFFGNMTKNPHNIFVIQRILETPTKNLLASLFHHLSNNTFHITFNTKKTFETNMPLPYNFKLQRTAVLPLKQAGLFGLSCFFSLAVITTVKNAIGQPETLKNLNEENILYCRPLEEKRDIYFFNWAPLTGEAAGRPKRD